MSDNNQQLDLYSMEIGQKALVLSVNANEIIRQRLFDMGVLPNCEIVKERSALGGDPVWVRLGSVQIALRKNEAQAVVVKIA